MYLISQMTSVVIRQLIPSIYQWYKQVQDRITFLTDICNHLTTEQMPHQRLLATMTVSYMLQGWTLW